MASIKITTGIKVYDIEDERGNVRGQISFNPADNNFPIRANTMYKNIQGLINDLQVIPEDSTDDDLANRIETFDNLVKKEINIFLDDQNASSVIFGNLNVFSTVGGVTLVENFLENVLPILKKEFEAEQKKANARIAKYTKQVK